MNTDSALLQENQGRTHLNLLDGLRAITALYVVAVHTLTLLDYRHDLIAGKWLWLTVLLSQGHYAVDVFIVISGFSLMLPIVRGNGTWREGALMFFKNGRAEFCLPIILPLFVYRVDFTTS